MKCLCVGVQCVFRGDAEHHGCPIVDFGYVCQWLCCLCVHHSVLQLKNKKDSHLFFFSHLSFLFSTTFCRFLTCLLTLSFFLSFPLSLSLALFAQVSRNKRSSSTSARGQSGGSAQATSSAGGAAKQNAFDVLKKGAGRKEAAKSGNGQGMTLIGGLRSVMDKTVRGKRCV